MDEDAGARAGPGPERAASGIERLVDVLSNTAMVVACIAVIFMMLHVSADAIGKYLLSRPMPATHEAVQFFYMVALVFLPIAYIARTEGHICVELFTRNMRRRPRAILDVGVGVLTLTWVGLIAWYAGLEAADMTALRELQETSAGYLITWPGRWFIPVGSGVMALAVAIRLLADIRVALGKTAPQ